MTWDDIRERNRTAWNAGRYESWVRGDGPPERLAAEIAADPKHVLRRLLPHLGDVAGKRICALQGSRGKAAVALALLGAMVTVIDFAEENRRYALELAAAAGVTLDYRVADSILADTLGLERFDATVMELGVLHYHQDIARFFGVVAALTMPGGTMVLNEFHPVQRKLFGGLGGAPPNYFHADLVIDDVPNPVRDGPRLGQCAYRFWTLGEALTAILGARFTIEAFEELPAWDDPRLPGMFTVKARLRP